jgi:hypothetical protein
MWRNGRRNGLKIRRHTSQQLAIAVFQAIARPASQDRVRIVFDCLMRDLTSTKAKRRFTRFVNTKEIQSDFDSAAQWQIAIRETR